MNSENFRKGAKEMTNCWFCGRSGGVMLYSHEYASHAHAECIIAHLEYNDYDAEVMAEEFGIINEEEQE